MRTRLIVPAVVCLLSGVVTATASPAAEAAVPAAVTAGLKSVADQCSEVGGKANTAAAVKRVDLNADGHEDFVLDVGSIECDGAASVYGDRQKGVTVFASDGKGGAVAAFNDWVFGAKLEGGGAAAKLWLTVSGEQCGKAPARDFASENFCDRAVVWNETQKKFEYAPISTVRMIQ